MTDPNESKTAEGLNHTLEKLAMILNGPLSNTETWPDDRRWWLQLGFNLGRFSEITNEGRRVWDDWKSAIETRDLLLAKQLLNSMKDRHTTKPPENSSDCSGSTAE
jgi:hypothetical protein